MQLARMDFLRQNNERSQCQTARVYIKTKNVCRTSWIIIRTPHPTGRLLSVTKEISQLFCIEKFVGNHFDRTMTIYLNYSLFFPDINFTLISFYHLLSVYILFHLISIMNISTKAVKIYLFALSFTKIDA